MSTDTELKVSVKDLLLFTEEWYDKKYPNLRFGQAFVNKFFPDSGDKTSHLFYEERMDVAADIIVNNFISYDDVDVKNSETLLDVLWS